jgi:hypothetical protein
VNFHVTGALRHPDCERLMVDMCHCMGVQAVTSFYHFMEGWCFAQGAFGVCTTSTPCPLQCSAAGCCFLQQCEEHKCTQVLTL